ncbi:Protein EFR3 [Psilocybe cubensis]|uniref:Protein EFR3 n=2 Tax=Psilocybe cubensis TaxID=181762 RepID=A0A8H7Y0I7_PSICU|nr:Protein EFR3 [Psilocybe cubensis]KAH9482387.1 Protein EFR3 [Psilocybe cubensis]
MNLFTPNHVKLLNSCYPPTSSLLTAGPEYSPNSHELSRLTYYASNHPGKLAKIAGELEKRLKAECKKAKSGNIRSRASLLISLSIFRSLATECRRDIALLSPSLIGSVDYTLASLLMDLEVTARAATVFTAWTTYTNGHLIGADSNMTKDYLSILKQFATLSCSISSDQETQNRTRLIGLAALTAALNSEALYNDIGNFGTQVSIILCPIMVILFETPLSTLDDQFSAVKDSSASPYLAEFRTRPALERRAASIHIHVDGDKGPSSSDVSDASLHALFSLLNHANGAQLGYIMQSSFDNLDSLQKWSEYDHCCWYAQRVAEWAQYQYRYVVPTWLVDRLLSQPESPGSTVLYQTLVAMVTSVFSAPTPLINLSSSDIMSNLLTLMLRCISINPEDVTLPALVECISSLGCHVYYSDQIQDLAGELVGRLVSIEVQGVLGRDKATSLQTRSSAIRCLLEGLLGLVRAANANERVESADETSKRCSPEPKSRTSLDTSRLERTDERASRRTRVPPDIWQDTLSLLCDSDPLVREECSNALVYYITQEMPKHGESSEPAAVKPMRRIADTFRHHVGVHPSIGDSGSKFLNSVHAYLYILATSPTLGISPSVVGNARLSSYDDSSSNAPPPIISDLHHDLGENRSAPSPSSNRRSIGGHNVSRARKESLVLGLLERTPSQYTTSAKASEEDYAHLLKILTTIQSRMPLHGLLTGIPMILALNAALNTQDIDINLLHRIVTIKTVIAHVWLVIGQVWKLQDLVNLAEKAIKNLSSFPNKGTTEGFPLDSHTLGIDVDEALSLVTSSQAVQEAFGMDQEGLTRRVMVKWTPELALRDFENSSAYETTLRGDGISPLLKISPALMHIENISLQSLTRSTRGLGVTDLREALEGRSSMSNPALARPPSVSTLDHASSSFMGGDAHLRLTQTRSRSRAAKKRPGPSGNGEVRDVLARLGISKQNSNLLKSTFPALQKSN